jgi:hypothetical protein
MRYTQIRKFYSRYFFSTFFFESLKLPIPTLRQVNVGMGNFDMVLTIGRRPLYTSRGGGSFTLLAALHEPTERRRPPAQSALATPPPLA